MEKSKNQTTGIAYNQFIDLDLKYDARNILILGNTIGLFGVTKRQKDNSIDIDTYQTEPRIWEYYKWLFNCINNKTVFYIIGNQQTIQYYSEIQSFFRQNGKKPIFKSIMAENDEDYKKCINILIKENHMELDYIIQNPPYSGSFHLEFLEKFSKSIKSTNGKMTIIEPATWLINLRKNGKAKKYDELKKMLDKHVNKVVIENYNKEFNVALSVPLSITYIDFSKEFNKIEFHCFGETKYVDSLYDCNFIGNYQTIWNIFDKVCDYKDMMKSHILNNSSTIYNDTCYAAVSKNMRGGLGDPRFSDEWFINNQYRCYYYHCFNDKEQISKTPHKLLCTGYTYENPKYKDELAINIYGSYEELSNFKNFIYNNKLSLFINICIIQDMNACSIFDFIPWLVDKRYTDEEINELFGFTDEEISLMDKTIKKFERYSPWFKRYMCGKDSVSEAEVQQFINSL